MKTFSTFAHKETYPLLLACFAFFVSLRYQDIRNEATKKIIIGLTGCLIISILGIYFASVHTIPFIIKISPQRATGLITFFGILFFIYYLIRKIEDGNIFNILLASYCLYALTFSLPVKSLVLPLFLFLCFDVAEGYLGCYRIRSSPFQLTSKVNHLNTKASGKTIACVFFFFSIISALYINSKLYDRWHNGYSTVAAAYLNVQLWAKKNTPPDALFMHDPTHSYGWRDFSERSSFGCFREWGYTTIVYKPDYKIYLEGIKKIKEFGINIEEITEKEIDDYKSFPYSETLREQIRQVYYNSGDNWRMNLAQSYGIDYFIMEKSKIKTQSSFHIAYENDHFIVYKPYRIQLSG